MDLGLKGRGALVTGASEGIGRGVAWALAAAGVDVAICARHPEPLERTAKQIADATGRKVVPIAADMGSLVDVQRFVAEAAGQLGRIDILVNSAGAARPGFVLDLPDDAFVEAVRVKLLGYIRCALAVVPYMRGQAGGCIVMIAGTAGRQPGPGMSTAGIVNAGVINFTKSLAEGVAKDNIRVVAITPSLVHTRRGELVEQAAALPENAPPTGRRLVTADIPLGRMADIEEIADAVLFLVSERGRFITGTTLSVDGGFTQVAF